MTQKQSKKPVKLRTLSKEQMLEEDRCRTGILSSWALMPGESIVDKAEREARRDKND